MPLRHRVGSCVLALVLGTGCGDSPSTASDAALSYGQDGVQSILPVAGAKVLTLGFVARNRSDLPVAIQSVEAVRTIGADISEVAVVGTPREIGEVASAVGFPPPDEGHWPPGSLKVLTSGVTLEPGSVSSEWGVNVLLRVDVHSDFALVAQYRVTGTVDGRPFTDVIDARTVICTDASAPSAACGAFADKHGVTV